MSQIKLLPVTLRSTATEQRYAEARQMGNLVPLHEEECIVDLGAWKIIENRFPYDAVFSTHHMLLPTRKVSDISELTFFEIAAMLNIIKGWCEIGKTYDMWFVNMPHKRTVPGHFHVHLVKFHKSRKDIKL